MSYTNTFIQISPDSSVTESVVPTSTRPKKPAHIIQFELLTKSPYQLNHKELIFEVFIRHKSIPELEAINNREEIWDELHAKPHPCLRASTLMKRFGWGAHYNEDGKIALYGIDSAQYKMFVNDDSIKKLLAMRSKRKKA